GREGRFPRQTEATSFFKGREVSSVPEPADPLELSWIGQLSEAGAEIILHVPEIVCRQIMHVRRARQVCILRNNCAQFVEANLRAQSARIVPRMRRNRSPCSKGW